MKNILNMMAAAALMADLVAGTGAVHVVNTPNRGAIPGLADDVVVEVAARIGAAGGDARRLLLSRMVVRHKLRPHDPLMEDNDGDGPAVDALLSEEPVPLDRAVELAAG